MRTRQMLLILDDLDYDVIQAEIAGRQRRSREIAPGWPMILPDGESNLAGAIIAEIVRDLNDYRALAERRRLERGDDV